ncbi:LamG-like jellyroll fold domain-containing protein [Hyalangium versicolor]|uniref:LamG-like jellyroll fold domain-containing protein n=1 Tax=Hyalangium versicolor TaxID=2861190 RepID=UPI001CCDE4D6|nr:LamG-like jellyroll fold domain-containing protein [Hyalangium versicolor]
MPSPPRSLADWKPLWRVWTIAVLLLPGLGHAAANCAELHAQNPSAPDGTYSFTLSGQQVELYCHDMAGTPREYLTLPHTGPTTNYSLYGPGNTSPEGLTTWYTQVRFEPETLTLVMDDPTFSKSQGSVRFGDTVISSHALASATSCSGKANGQSNVDLTGTPFDILPEQFQTDGHLSDGVAVFTGTQIVNMVGGGACGGITAVDNRLRLNLRSAPEVPPELVHSYSFTLSASDSVSGANGSLEGDAWADEEVFLNGTDAYVSLPISDTLVHLDDATFEVWVTWNEWEEKTAAHIFHFFNDATNSSLALIATEDTRPLFAITSPDGDRVQVLPSKHSLPLGVPTQLVVTLDPTAKLIRLYVNGLEVARSVLKYTPSQLGPLTNNWLGRAQQAATPFFRGSISEFRVYRTVLSPSLIAARFSDPVAPGAPSFREPSPSQRFSTATPRFSGMAEPGSTVTLLVDGVKIGSVEANDHGDWSYQLTAPLSWGEHRASATATDNVGNISAPFLGVSFSTAQLGVYGLSCAASSSSWQSPWLWALLLIGLLRPRSCSFQKGPLH